MRFAKTLLIGAGILELSHGAADGWFYRDFPNPMKDFAKCGNRDASHVCDPDGVLADEQERLEIDNLAQRLRNESEARIRCADGTEKPLQVGVALLSRMVPYAEDDWLAEADLAELFAVKIAEQWQLGDRDCNNAVIIFVSQEQRTLRIQAAAGATSLISDSDMHKIVEMMITFMKEGEPFNALKIAIDSLQAVGEGKPLPGNNFLRTLRRWMGGILLALLYGAIFAIISYFKTRATNRQIRRIMDYLERGVNPRGAHEASDDEIRAAGLCPICLDDFPDSPHQHSHDDPDVPPDQGDSGPKPGIPFRGASDLSDADEKTSLLQRKRGSKDGQPGTKDPIPPDPKETKAKKLDKGTSVETMVDKRADTTAEAKKLEENENDTSTVEGEDTATDILTLACGHTFHGRCIREWNTQTTTCPICRQSPDDIPGVTPESTQLRTDDEDDVSLGDELQAAIDGAWETHAGYAYRQEAGFMADRFHSLHADELEGVERAAVRDWFMEPYRVNIRHFWSTGPTPQEALHWREPRATTANSSRYTISELRSRCGLVSTKYSGKKSKSFGGGGGFSRSSGGRGVSGKW